MSSQQRYVSALGFAWLTGLYAPIVALAIRDRAFKRRFLRQADIREGHRVLDRSCGTGTLAIWAKQSVPDAEVFGVDGDRRILDMARRKAQTLGVEIVLDHGSPTKLSYESSSFDWELKPGGKFPIADWGKPQDGVMRILFCAIQLLDGFDNTRDNVRGLLPAQVA